MTDSFCALRQHLGKGVLGLCKAQRYTRDQDCVGRFCHSALSRYMDVGDEIPWIGMLSFLMSAQVSS